MRLWKSKTKTETNDNGSTVEKLNFSELIDLIFLILPYIKLIKRIRAEYQSDNQAEVFRFTIQTLLEGMDKGDLYKIISIAGRIPEEKAKEMSLSEFILLTPKIIRANNLIDLYLLMKRLGAIDG